MIEWLDINNNIPESNKMYLVRFTEYLGITPIYGFKLSKYTESFDVPKNYLVTHFSNIPAYINENNHSRM